MARTRALILTGALAGGALWGQQKAPPPKQQEPVEEDASRAEKQYSFNPLQAQKDLRVGNFYFKKGKWRAAADRFREATLWNPGSAEAYLRLGEAEEKMNDQKAAQEAYRKYLELAPSDKRAEEVKKKLAGKR